MGTERKCQALNRHLNNRPKVIQPFSLSFRKYMSNTVMCQVPFWIMVIAVYRTDKVLALTEQGKG